MLLQARQHPREVALPRSRKPGLGTQELDFANCKFCTEFVLSCFTSLLEMVVLKLECCFLTQPPCVARHPAQASSLRSVIIIVSSGRELWLRGEQIWRRAPKCASLAARTPSTTLVLILGRFRSGSACPTAWPRARWPAWFAAAKAMAGKLRRVLRQESPAAASVRVEGVSGGGSLAVCECGQLPVSSPCPSVNRNNMSNVRWEECEAIANHPLASLRQASAVMLAWSRVDRRPCYGGHVCTSARS